MDEMENEAVPRTAAQQDAATNNEVQLRYVAIGTEVHQRTLRQREPIFFNGEIKTHPTYSTSKWAGI